MIFSLIKYWTAVLFFEAGVSWPLDLDVGFIACFLLIIGESDHQTLSRYIPVSKADMSRGDRGENVSKYSRMGTWTFHKECMMKERKLNSNETLDAAVVPYPITSTTLLLILAGEFMKLLRIGHWGFERDGESLIVTRREGAGLRT